LAAYRFSLHEDRIAPGGWVEIATPAANRILYCVEGSLGVGGGSLGDLVPLERDEARLAIGLTRLETGHTGALVLRWELTPAEQQEELEEAGVTSGLLMERTIELPEEEERLMRLDAVALTPGASDPSHIIPGPSLRVLANGAVSVALGDQTTPHRPGGAWFVKEGEEASVSADDTAPALTFRAAILPTSLKGESAIFYAEKGEGDGPPRARVYVDREILL
jgi:quercetin dioxygenase-like cupin family protein